MSDMVLNTRVTMFPFPLFFLNFFIKDCIWVKKTVMEGVIINIVSDTSFFFLYQHLQGNKTYYTIKNWKKKKLKV